MAIRRLVTEKQAEQNTYDHLKRMFDLVPEGQSKTKIQSSLDSVKSKIIARLT